MCGPVDDQDLAGNKVDCARNNTASHLRWSAVGAAGALDKVGFHSGGSPGIVSCREQLH